MTTSSAMPRPPARLTLRRPEDLFAAAPVLLGFWPEQSVVLMTFGARHPFHARIDLPPTVAGSAVVRRQLAAALLGPALRHGADQVVLLYYAEDSAPAEAAHRTLRRACRRSGLEVLAALATDGTHYRDLEHRVPAARSRRHPVDVSAHPFVVEAIVDGRLAHRTRADLVSSVDQNPAAAEAVASALRSGRHAEDGVPASDSAVREAGAWVAHAVRDLVADETPPGDDDLAHLLWVMQAPRVRDAAWSTITRASAQEHVRLWSGVVRRAPESLVAAPAALLGWAAWQAGDGALAWIAVDRCTRASPGYRMAALLASLLQDAVPPAAWQGGPAWDRGLPERWATF
ncbi:DUF4192 domain-containing protein [Nocardioides sp. R1-1]|uniref:DUF4192 domain-containing protein n=1 Tax=Nocardioides sp. R1-1 TaxID=3383502 RepID=UPI0038D001E1